MIPAVPLALVTHALFGLLFALAARQQLQAGRPPWRGELVALGLFEALVGWPVALYFCLVFPDWSWLYLVDPHRLPWGASLLVLLGLGVALVGAFTGGWALQRRKNERLLLGLVGGVALLDLVLALVFRGRLGAVGTYAEFHAGRALGLGSGKLPWSLGITSLGTLAAAAATAGTLWREGHKDAVPSAAKAKKELGPTGSFANTGAASSTGSQAGATGTAANPDPTGDIPAQDASVPASAAGPPR